MNAEQLDALPDTVIPHIQMKGMLYIPTQDRPTERTILQAAALELLEEYQAWDSSASTDDECLMRALRNVLLYDGYDGYAMCKALEDELGIQPDSALVSIMDDASNIIHDLVTAAEICWVQATNQTPIFAVGDVIQLPSGYTQGQGTITGINRETGRYYVKINPSDTNSYIIRWEDARSVS